MIQVKTVSGLAQAITPALLAAAAQGAEPAAPDLYFALTGGKAHLVFRDRLEPNDCSAATTCRTAPSRRRSPRCMPSAAEPTSS